MKYFPLHDKVLVERLEVETVSPGGLYLPATTAGKSSKGKVLAVGPGKRLNDGQIAAMTVKVGQNILFNEGYGVKTQKIDGKEILFLSESDILAIIAD